MEKPFMFDYDTGELNCILCKNKYTSYNDPFICIIDTNKSIEITYELCLTCVNSFIYSACQNCNRKYEEPWEHVYFNKLDNTHYGKCCYKKK